MFRLDDRVAVVTGGAAGIGLAIARRLHDAGARLVIADIADGSEVADQLGGLFVRTDVSIGQEVEALMATAGERFDRIDILVNNAGIALGVESVGEQSDSDYRDQFGVNVMGVVNGIRYVTRWMPDGGSIVNIASLAGVIGFPGYGSYVASKWAVVGLTKTAALELASRRIRVNAVCPSGIATAMYDPSETPGEIALIETAQPIARPGTPDEVAAAVQFLVADDCALLTGQALVLDGGLSAGPSIATMEMALEKWTNRSSPSEGET